MMGAALAKRGSPHCLPHPPPHPKQAYDWTLLLLASLFAFVSGGCLPATLYFFSGTMDSVGAAMAGGFNSDEMLHQSKMIMGVGCVYAASTAAYTALADIAKVFLETSLTLADAISCHGAPPRRRTRRQSTRSGTSARSCGRTWDGSTPPTRRSANCLWSVPVSSTWV